MTLLELISKALAGAALSAPELVALLTRLKELAPDLAATVDRWLAGLSKAVLPENLAAVGSAVLGELKDIGTGKIVPKEHPSDAF